MESWSLSRGLQKSYVNNLKLIAKHLCSQKNSLCHQEFLTGALFSLGVWSLILPSSRWARWAGRSAPSGEPSLPRGGGAGSRAASAQLGRSRRDSRGLRPSPPSHWMPGAKQSGREICSLPWRELCNTLCQERV